MSDQPSSPSVTASPERLRAEILYEELGGDLCICQRADVSHWCEKCQQGIGRIMSFLNDSTREALTQAQQEKDAAVKALNVVQQAAKTIIAGSDRLREAEVRRLVASGLSTLDSEREMNAILTRDLEAAEAAVAQRQDVDKRHMLQDMGGDWQFAYLAADVERARAADAQQIAQLQDGIEQVQMSAEIADANAVAARRGLQDAEQQIAEAGLAHRLQQETIHTLQAHVGELQQQIAALRAERDYLREQVAGQAGIITDVKAQLTALQAEQAQWQQTQRDVLQALREAQTLLAALTAQQETP